MKKILLLSVIFLIPLLFMAFTSPLPSKVGDKAPEFKLKDLNGKEVKLSDYKGKIVLIDFWATWCGPCRKGIPDLIELQNEYKNEIVVLGITLDNKTNTAKDVDPFVKNMKINYPVLWTDDETIKNYGNINSIPTSFVVDKKGVIVSKHVGLVAKSEYVKDIKKAQANK